MRIIEQHKKNIGKKVIIALCLKVNIAVIDIREFMDGVYATNKFHN